MSWFKFVYVKHTTPVFTLSWLQPHMHSGLLGTETEWNTDWLRICVYSLRALKRSPDPVLELLDVELDPDELLLLLGLGAILSTRSHSKCGSALLRRQVWVWPLHNHVHTHSHSTHCEAHIPSNILLHCQVARWDATLVRWARQYRWPGGCSYRNLPGRHAGTLSDAYDVWLCVWTDVTNIG